MHNDDRRSVETVCAAIGRRHRLALAYKDDIRVVEPYILGCDAGGSLWLSAVQVLGGSGPGFRSFAMEDVAALAMADERFAGDHPGYNPRDRFFTRVLCRV